MILRIDMANVQCAGITFGLRVLSTQTRTFSAHRYQDSTRTRPGLKLNINNEKITHILT